MAYVIAGKYGSEIRPAFWLNMPFLLVPIWGAVSLFSRPRDVPLIGASKVKNKHYALYLVQKKHEIFLNISNVSGICIRPNVNRKNL